MFNQIKFVAAVLASTLIMLGVSACKKEIEAVLQFNLDDPFDRMEVQIINETTQQKDTLFSDQSFERVMTNVNRDVYAVHMAAFYPNSEDTASYLFQKFSVSSVGFTGSFTFVSPDKITFSEITDSWDGKKVTASWNNSEHPESTVEVYVSEDSATIFLPENRRETDGNKVELAWDEHDLFVALKRTSPYDQYRRWYVKSEVFRVSVPFQKYFYAKPDEWIHINEEEFADYRFRFLVETGKWYLLEGYDNYNSDETATELIVLPGSQGGYCTREPDGHSFFIVAKSDTIEAFATISFVTGTLGSFKLRLTSLAQASPSQIEGEHEFAFSNQVKYASQFFQAGEHTLSMFQNDIQTDAYVYYTILKDNDYLQVEENTVLKPAHDLGPNFREDSATQVHTFTLTQPATLQMIMVAGFHGKPDVLTVTHQ